MRALALIASSLNISAYSSKMEDFIYFLLKLGIELKNNFKDHSLNPEDLFHISDYIKILAEEVFSKCSIFLNNQ